MREVRYCSRLGARRIMRRRGQPVSTAAGRTPVMWAARRLWILVFLIVLAAGAPAAAAPCASSLSACPTRGCAEPGTADAKVNAAKRAAPSEPLLHLTLDDFEALQQQASAKPGVGTNKAITNRALL